MPIASDGVVLLLHSVCCHCFLYCNDDVLLPGYCSVEQARLITVDTSCQNYWKPSTPTMDLAVTVADLCDE